MKIKITSDISVLKKVMVVSAGLFIICIIGLLIYTEKYSKYIEVTAEIVNIRSVYDNKGYDNQNRNKYIQYLYTFNDKKYTADRLVFFGSKRSIGKEVTIKINPHDPYEIANYTFIRSFVVIGIISAILFVLIIRQYKIRKN